jgi:predicted  nucleic acid-binding Zn-ribbon protein
MIRYRASLWPDAEQRAQADEAAEQALREVHQLRDELAEARSAATQAETERESAQRAAEQDRATIQSLRQQLEQQRQDHHHDLNALRQEAQDERAALAQHYADQITAIFATIQQAGNPTQSKPVTQKIQRSDADSTKRRNKHQPGSNLPLL